MILAHGFIGFEQSKVKVKVKDTLCLPHDHRCVQHSQFYFADRFFAIQKGSLDIRRTSRWTMRFSTDSKRKFTLLKTF